MTGYAFVLASGQLERLQAVSNIASIAAASDVPVDVFATMDGLEAFDESVVESGDFEAGPVAQAMMESDRGEMPLFTESFEQAKAIGPISMYACELSIDLLEKSMDDYLDLFDDVLGVSGFLNHARDKQVVFV
jgi:peroxiredoxin family protein